MKLEPTPKIFPHHGSSPADSGGAATAREEREAHLWSSLVPHLIHPVKLVILEALLYMEQELAASQISSLVGEHEYSTAVISYHLKVMAKAGVIELVESKKVRGSEMHLFDLAKPATA
ncbi:MAG TPA: helix-turn-helix domain-containing protein [Solirubrobacterales bacterium]|nr:helix-turn-helix domain-containing protein [Solirubrobacterales bacterium]